MRFLVVFIFIFSFSSVFAQSGRVAPIASPTPSPAEKNPPKDLTVEQLYAEANAYAKNKFAEYERRKVPFAENVYFFVLREQKQLAAKNAAMARTRRNLAGEDFLLSRNARLDGGKFRRRGRKLTKIFCRRKSRFAKTAIVPRRRRRYRRPTEKI